MTRLRPGILFCAALAAGAGLAAGTASLMQGAFDQAVAFTWPGVATSIALMLLVPSRSTD